MRSMPQDISGSVYPTIEIEHDAESAIGDWLFSIVLDSNT
jgi:hypothetical protein